MQISMDSNNLKFKTLSLNVRGIRTFEKRKSIFNWLTKQNSDICFLQETYSTEEIENQWKKQWSGDIFFAHGSNHSRGVAILIRKSFDFKLKSIRSDEEGRYLILETTIQDIPFLLVNIYAPNTTTKQSLFFQTLSELIYDEGYNEFDYKIILGGDLNVTMDPDLDCSGGNPVLKDSVKCVEDIMLNYDLVDIWRIRNPNSKKFSWRQKKPIVQRRLDYWLISDLLQDDVVKVDIVTAIRTDHHAITLEIDSINDQQRGPSFWKFNNSLLDDDLFVERLRENFPKWIDEINFCDDSRIKWDWMKYKIRGESISYSKLKAKERRNRIQTIEDRLKMCEEKIAESPTQENLANLESAKTEYEKEYDYIVRGSIIRSRATWFEQGERNNKYFLNLENRNKKKSCIRKLIRANGEETTVPDTIMTEIHSFYSELYDEKPGIQGDYSTCPFLEDTLSSPKLTDSMRETCEGQLTYSECFKVLSTFSNDKTPGNDGLTIEFYKFFWSEIGTFLVDSLNYAHFHGELSHSQKQAVITLIEKKDKDRRWIKNWRPISLVNVDVKIGSKAIAKRLENVLPHIIHYDQNAFVKGRTIFDATRTISDVLEFTKMRNYQGIMTAIDFEKAFDSLNWNFLHKSLEFFGFGESFLGWIKTFYTNISSCVINNGFSTPTFNVKRGVRQGDPLSPSLFIIVLELLALSIRNNDQIKGIAVDGSEIKLVIFADDMTSFVRDKLSHRTLFDTIDLFSAYSGLKVNHDKTEILLLGNMEVNSSELGVNEISKVIKILGVHFTFNHSLFYKLNFESIEKSLRGLLKSWSWRGLTLLGKIQVIKSFAVPKILYRVVLISNKKEFIKKINTLLYSFVWKGKDKVKRTAFINPIEKGGLKMPNIESMISAQRIICIKRYLSTDPASWKLFLDFYLKKVGGKFLFHCNFNYTKLPIILPEFYKECVVAWTLLSEDNPSSSSDIANQVIWNNQFICIGSKSIYNSRLIDLGIVRIGDLYDTRGEFKSNKEPLYSTLSPVEHFLLFSLFNAFPQEWRKILKTNKNSISSKTHDLIQTDFELRIEGKKVNFQNLKSKSLYDNFVSKISSIPTAQKKYNEAFSTHTFQLDWGKIYLLPFKTTLDTKLREFQYKILNRILYTNKMLFKFKKVVSPLCDFCEKELETIEHLFFHCTKVSTFWDELKVVLNSLDIAIRFDIKNVLFGILDADNISILVNYILLESKYFIYRCKLNKGSLCVRLLVDKFRKTFQTERFIAKKNNKIHFHNKKWKPLLPLIQQ